MSRLARGAVLAMAALACAVSAGCANDTSERNAYVTDVNTAQTDFADTVTRISKAITLTRSAEQNGRALRPFKRAVEDALHDLRGIAVPSGLDAEHSRLVAAIAGFGEALQIAIAELRSRPSRRTAQEAQRAIVTAMSTVNSRILDAIAGINRKLGV